MVVAYNPKDILHLPCLEPIELPDLGLALRTSKGNNRFTAVRENVNVSRPMVVEIDDDLVAVDTQDCWHKRTINPNAWV